jgi:photosystem II stability/assembly factor-like uncharacterized protein
MRRFISSSLPLVVVLSAYAACTPDGGQGPSDQDGGQSSSGSSSGGSSSGGSSSGGSSSGGSSGGGSSSSGSSSGGSSGGEGGVLPDGSATGWQEADSPVPGASISQISFVDDQKGYLLISDQLAAGTQNVYYTDDGGGTWQPRQIAGNLPSTIAFANGGQSVWIGGNGEQPLWYSSDSGMTFAPFPFSPVDWPGSSFFWNNQTGLIGSETGDSVYKTTDGGTTWVQSELTGVPGASVMTVVGNDVYVVGGVSSEQSGAAIAHSPDQGTTWTVQNLTDNANLYQGGELKAITVVSPTEFWVAGEGEQIYHTTDGMKTWAQVKNVPSTIDTFGGIAVSGNDVMVLGWSQQQISVYESSDGGTTFTVTFQGSCSLQCDEMRLAVASPTLAYAYGYGGTFYRYTK